MGQTSRVQGRATTVKKDSAGNLVVTYHSTDVVTVKPDGTVELRTGGWRTATTLQRMRQASNQYKLGYSVYQKAYAWFVEWKGQTLPFDGDRLTLPA
jgi:hypothetical protein